MIKKFQDKRIYFILALLVFVILSSFTILLPLNTKPPASRQSTELTFETHQTPVVLGTTTQKPPNLPSTKTIFVQFTGAINNPQVLELENGTRMFEAIDLLGGFAENVSNEFVNKHLNLASVLYDGQMIYIPFEGEEFTQTNLTTNAGFPIDVGNDNMKININSATLNELITLPGIGQSTAQKIIDYRNTSGDFRKLEDIKNISGIGDKTYDDIKDLITI